MTRLLGLFGGFLILITSKAWAEDEVRIAWTGASFVPQQVIALTTRMINEDKTGLTVTSTKMSRGGTSLGAAIQRHNLLGVIREGKFDYVVVNEIVLAVKTRDEQACKQAREHIAQVVKACKESGGRPIFFCTWLRTRTMERNFELFLNHYKELATKHNGVLAPIGPAWKKAWEMEKEETLQLYATDNNHASNRGVYLAACVMYSVLTGKSPVGKSAQLTPNEIPRRGSRNPLDEKTATLLQRAAWETFQEYCKVGHQRAN